ncbi:DUF6770 family protein [Flavobacterium sp.]|uniref:DUF6770 family protein n=1 Tax=Flavobacterium sp. TaxID=239 RepID=UPI002610792A|nr:DUF6770 family protein [Flavobacterium sp.]
MMRKLLLLLFFVTSVTVSAQTTKLSALSSADYLSSKIVYDDNGNDVYGYFLLYQKDKKSKGNFELEYVLLDKNLNKMASGTFAQQRATSMFVDFTTELLYVKKLGDKIYFSLGDVMKGYEDMYDMFGLYGLRTLDLKDFKVSEVTYMRNFAPAYGDITKMKRKEMDEFQYMKPTQNNGFVVFEESVMDISMRVFMGKRNARNIRKFRFYDMDLKEKWSYEYKETGDKSFYEYNYFGGEGNDMVFFKEFYEKASDRHSDISYEFFDVQSGKKKFEIRVNDTQNLLRVRRILFEENKVIVFAATNDFNNKDNFAADKITGYAKITYDRATGKELGRSYFKWEQLADKLEIDAYGKIKSYGFIHFLDYKRTTDGKTIVIGEGFSVKGGSEIRDLFTFVFDDNMKLVDYQVINKLKNGVPAIGYGTYLQSIGAFDYMYSQKLPGDGYVFYYADNEKKSKKNPSWVLGIVTYVDGAFSTQKVTLTTQKGQIYPLKAKNGYILLREDTDKDSELRLEKINY